jgi:hypothetical protein
MRCHVIAGEWRALKAAAATPTYGIVAEPLERCGQRLDMKWWDDKGPLLSLRKLDWKHQVGVKVKLGSRSLRHNAPSQLWRIGLVSVSASDAECES